MQKLKEFMPSRTSIQDLLKVLQAKENDAIWNYKII